MNPLSFLKKSVGDVVSDIRNRQAQIEQKKKQREDLQHLPLPREDFIAAIHEYIDARKVDFSDSLKLAYAHYVNGYRERVDVPLLEARGAHAEQGKVFSGNLYGLFAEPIKQAVTAEIQRWDWPAEVGPARSERPAMITKLDREIATLEAEEAELRTQAEQAGIAIARVAPAVPRKR